jgi:microcystin-dependent protein
MPIGMIVMWNSTAASIPSGWQLCDGSNGTPNLRGQFIVGAGGTYTPGDQGGSATVTLDSTQMPIHTHGLSGTLTTSAAGAHSHSVSDPGHTHNLSGSTIAPGSGAQSGSGYSVSASTLTTTSSATGITVGTAPDHAHSVALTGSTLSAGGTGGVTQAHENRPPYYALCYIQKMY